MECVNRYASEACLCRSSLAVVSILRLLLRKDYSGRRAHYKRLSASDVSLISRPTLGVRRRAKLLQHPKR
jgi:hypothetical protein